MLLEELLEQEKREQEKQQQQQQQHQQVDNSAPTGALLSDSDFERLRADVLGSASLASPPQGIVTAGVPIMKTTGPTNWTQPISDATKLTVQVPRQPIATQTPPEREYSVIDNLFSN